MGVQVGIGLTRTSFHRNVGIGCQHREVRIPVNEVRDFYTPLYECIEGTDIIEGAVTGEVTGEIMVKSLVKSW